MGTRGLVGFFVNGEPKISYNHFDSYPDSLGIQTLLWLRVMVADRGPAWVKQAALSVKTVPNEMDAPPAQVVAELERKGYADPSVGNQGMGNKIVHTWYQGLRGTQGDLTKILDAGWMIEGHDFGLDGLFCEWGYVIVLDGDGQFQAYQGFSHTDHNDGLWGINGLLRPSDWKPETQYSPPYYPIRLIKSWPLFDLPTIEEFLEACSQKAE